MPYISGARLPLWILGSLGYCCRCLKNVHQFVWVRHKYQGFVETKHWIIICHCCCTPLLPSSSSRCLELAAFALAQIHRAVHTGAKIMHHMHCVKFRTFLVYSLPLLWLMPCHTHGKQTDGLSLLFYQN